MGGSCSRKQSNDDFSPSEAQMKDMEARRKIDLKHAPPPPRQGNNPQQKMNGVGISGGVKSLPLYSPAQSPGHHLDQSATMNAVSIGSGDLPSPERREDPVPRRLN
ncbi:Hypothetical protein, putative [Bodo saltans]|uniref:Uncharacterized protein n=1 Tax=Bodo saltans TaxID=75058 RepID=A0A0S4KJH9_BODSA|nr:Hypothetical protein, putative [Bodo saltans]|eukprot:CUI14613.1 Hypothetical protein, putative [Bodo saltans]